MRSVLGIMLVGIGLAMAVMWLPAYDAERQLAVITEIATQGMARVSVPDPMQTPAESARTNRTFSPQLPLYGDARASNGAANPAPAADKVVTSSSAATSVVATVQPTAPASLANVATLTVTAAASPPRLTSTRPVDDNRRADLVRNLQRELKRVGCYQGEIDGDWGSGSKRAMSTFTDRVNASLPFDEPDYILLTLVQGHGSQACGKTCPAGQTASDAGKCIPNAVVAQAMRRPQQEARTQESPKKAAPQDHEPVRTAAVAADTQRRPDTRPETQPETRTETGRTTASNWTTTIEQPAIVAAPAVAALAAAAATLPGRMSVGAAVNAPASTEPEATPATQAVRKHVQQSHEGRTARSNDDDQPARQRPRDRERSKPRQQVASAPAPRAVVVYREPPKYRPPAVYFAPPQPRRAASSRAWTANFFDRF